MYRSILFLPYSYRIVVFSLLGSIEAMGMLPRGGEAWQTLTAWMQRELPGIYRYTIKPVF
ncbi:MAG: hypothetical protein J7641_05770 [Cyanobacteria bacterium SID2]|nr:hypothetical protein [Cyanobacteria bacterium SID2]MBP0002649.1 hypothetical protein [Cyanobacteria bacterium SBC]